MSAIQSLYARAEAVRLALNQPVGSRFDISLAAECLRMGPLSRIPRERVYHEADLAAGR